ncbi:MAG: DUF763 domain-containing protein [Candidatus Aenigmatarchaeota archaeon]
MIRKGFVELRLASGPVPHYKEMVKLARPILEILVEEYGSYEVIKRFSDALWFQCFACLLGFEWNYSGMTTVTIKAIKDALKDSNLPIKVVGGKGKEAINTLEEIEKLEIKNKDEIKKASILSAKADNVELQDGYDLYFHSLIVDENGNFSIINQKMNINNQKVRRLHWIANTKVFEEEPHNEIIGIKEKVALNLFSKDSKETRKAIVDIVKDYSIEKIEKTLIMLNKKQNQKLLVDYLKMENFEIVKLPYYFKIPKKIDKKALEIAKNAENFEDILKIRGIGKDTIRGLAYIANIIFGTRISWKDPIKFTYAHGTKAGKPYYVDKERMLKEAEILRQVIEEAKLGNKEKIYALKRLSKIIEM